MTRPLRTGDRVRHGSSIGIVASVVRENALVIWNDGGSCYFAIASLTYDPLVCSVEEAIAFVTRAKELGAAESVAVPMRVLDALVAGCRVK